MVPAFKYNFSHASLASLHTALFVFVKYFTLRYRIQSMFLHDDRHRSIAVTVVVVVVVVVIVVVAAAAAATTVAVRKTK